MAKSYVGIRIDRDVKAGLDRWAAEYADGNRSRAVNVRLRELLGATGHAAVAEPNRAERAAKGAALLARLENDPPPPKPPASIYAGMFGDQEAMAEMAKKRAEWEARWKDWEKE